jgi:hypothetical protein
MCAIFVNSLGSGPNSNSPSGFGRIDRLGIHLVPGSLAPALQQNRRLFLVVQLSALPTLEGGAGRQTPSNLHPRPIPDP